jgi:hypothetical protein
LSFSIHFRHRESENTAERLIHDLRTDDCSQIVGRLNSEIHFDPRVCSVMKGTTRDFLVWRKDTQQTRVFVYAIPEKQARLWVVFHLDEVGFVVSSVTVVR